MSDILSTTSAPRSITVDTAASSYIDWTAVISGALVGIAIIATMTAFGSALGLSLTLPAAGRSVSAGAAIAIAIWTLWVVISGYIAAGYIAGRMRHQSIDISVDEAEFRNGAHGLVAWAITTLVVAVLTTFVVFGGERALNNSASRVGDHVRYVSDQLLRTERTEAAYDEGLHREVASVLRKASMTSPPASEDKSYLVGQVTLRGATSADAERRVDAAIADVRANAETTRKVGILVSFLAAASLAVGAAAAWWAATRGGAHRLDYRGISIFTRWH
jgi:hypothetical protein